MVTSQIKSKDWHSIVVFYIYMFTIIYVPNVSMI